MEILGDSADHYGVVLESIDQNQRFALDADRVVPSGSVYKLGVAVEVLRQVDSGRLHLADTITILDEDALEPEPEGGLSPGETPTLEDALRVMLSVSSNSAGHALLRLIGRPSYNQAIAALGLTHTRVPLLRGDSSAESADPAAESGADEVAVTTPSDMALLLRLLATGKVLSPASLDLLYTWMQVGGEPRPVEESLPAGVTVEAKAGNLERASNVAALVFEGGQAFSLTVLDEDVDPGDARITIGRLALAAYEQLMKPS
jgi:beta-lactamase class A